jgi:hypothetical protein
VRPLARHLRWPALGACILLAAAYIASAFWCFAWIGPTRSAGIGRGVFWLTTPYTSAANWPTGPALGRAVDAQRCWNFNLGGNQRLTLARQLGGSGEYGLWLLLIPVAAATAFLFWRHARSRPLHLCRDCGYDLTGTPRCPDGSRQCPECGTLQTAEPGARAC